MCLVSAALLLSSPASTLAQQSKLDSVRQACEAADTATRWKQVRKSWLDRARERGSNASLRARLLELGRRDQALRSVPDLRDSMRSPDFRARLHAADSANAAVLIRIVARYGWPTPELVGIQAADAAFLIAQHNDRLQKPMLKRMLALPPGEVSPENLALLQDRVRTREGKPQLYGTQLRGSAGGKTLTFDPIEDVAHLDERRAKVGLAPLDTYICVMRGAYGMNVVDPRKATKSGS